MRYMIAATIISAALFTGCKKEDSMTGIAVQEIGNGTTNVTYQLQTLVPPAGSLVKWDKGYATASAILFNGTHYNGEMIVREQFAAKDGKTVVLFGTPVLGSVNVPYNAFSSVSATIQLNPLNENNALFLSGVHYIVQTGPSDNPVPINTIPVQVMISDPIMLGSAWIDNVTINQPSYTAILSLDLSQLTNGILPRMLEIATATNGVVIISSTSNQNLYGIIVKNLQSNVMTMQLSAGIISAVPGQPITTSGKPIVATAQPSEPTIR